MSYDVGGERYRSKRRAGISGTRRDGTTYSEFTDQEAFKFESEEAAFWHVEPDCRIFEKNGDGGVDFTLRVVRMDVKNEWPHLVINPEDLGRHDVDVYSIRRGHERRMISAVRFEQLMRDPCVCTIRRLADGRHDFGYGPKWAVHYSKMALLIGDV